MTIGSTPKQSYQQNKHQIMRLPYLRTIDSSEDIHGQCLDMNEKMNQIIHIKNHETENCAHVSIKDFERLTAKINK